MKRILALMLTIILMSSLIGGVFAESLANLQDRNIVNTLQHFDDNPIIPNESPTTGKAWQGKYTPMLVQIDLTDGGVGYRAPWGAELADVTYETPLYKNGTTRLSLLFSDNLPDAAGPVRSARVGHCWLREEWGAGFIFYGTQELKGSSCSAVFRETGANKKQLIFNGINAALSSTDFRRVESLKAPSNVTANVKSLAAKIPDASLPAPRPFLFTDEAPADGQLTATKITVDLHHKVYNSEFVYNKDTNSYDRYVQGQRFHSRDFATGATHDLSYNNLIIQRTKVGWNNGNGVAPLTEHIGKGNADIFIAGQYIPGYWVRPDYKSRTVYLDQDGNEIKLTRGNTFILVTQYDTDISYSN